jgi:monoamine oxidase
LTGESLVDIYNNGPINKKIVIIAGAGIAGLTCAHYLEIAGFKVVLLEAGPRVGGRLRDLPSISLTFKQDFINNTLEAGG